MKIYTIVAQPANQPMYVTTSHTSLAEAKNQVIVEFGTVTKEQPILPGTSMSSVAQFLTYCTLIDIVETEVKLKGD